jgi:sterol desaturase/sphingolipid hydroxylase (fatty acid hydroxylase superfamily)
MQIFQTLYNEIIGFLGIDSIIQLFKTGDYSSLHTIKGILGIMYPIIPFLLIIEVIRAIFYKKSRVSEFRMPFFIYVFNRFVGRFISIAAVGFCIAHFEKYGIFKSSLKWYWIIYAYIAWELGHFFYHYFAHKIRLFWCLHSTHHAPQSMNLSVNFAHFILEAPYADVIRTTTCILLGVSPPLLFLVMTVDGIWGSFIHIGDETMKNARLGFLNQIILTPSAHRVHHARNPAYMDTNFCNLLNIWDRIFGTFTYERQDIPVEYGITRKINTNNFWDVYFGEIYLLGKDIIKAPGIKNKLLYIIMPPGWSHTGEHKTAKAIRKLFLASDLESRKGIISPEAIPAELLN